MDYLCSECSIQLSKFEIELNELYPVGKLYCEFCQSKHEREIIKKLAEIEADMENDWVKQISQEFTEDLLGAKNKVNCTIKRSKE